MKRRSCVADGFYILGLGSIAKGRTRSVVIEAGFASLDTRLRACGTEAVAARRLPIVAAAGDIDHRRLECPKITLLEVAVLNIGRPILNIVGARRLVIRDMA